MELTSRPSEFLSSLDRLAPKLWLKIDRCRSNTAQWPREFVLPSWACDVNELLKLDAESSSDHITLEDVKRFAPAQAATWMARGIRSTDPVLLLTPERAAMFYAWRATKLEFRFDPSFARELLDTPIADDIPADILSRLPATCVYVSLPEGTGDWAGIYAFLDQPERKAAPVLRIFRDSPGRWPSQAFVLPISGGSLSAAMQRRHQEFVDHVRAALEGRDPDAVAKADALHARQDKVEHETRQLGKLLSLLLYLCAEQPDLPDDYAPTSYQQKGAGSLRRIVPPAQTRCWPVGVRLGAVFRKAAEEHAASESNNTATSAVRPHIRRAHWHTYWVGPKEQAKATLRWISPVLVGARSAVDSLPTVIHPVLP